MRTPNLDDPFVRKQIEYTREREQRFILEQKKIDAEYVERLRRTYARTADLIEQEISRQYLRYADKEGLTPEEAYKKVSKMDVEAFAEKAAEYVKNKDFSPEANEQLRAYNLRMRVSRMEYMGRSAEIELLRLESKEKAMLEAHLQETSMKELKRQAGILGLESSTVRRVEKNAHEIIYGDFQGAPFSARLWLNNRDMVNRVRVGIERSILQGQHPREWAKNLHSVLTDTMLGGKNNALFNAERLAITETARVQELTALDSFKEGGYEEYIWIAEQDERTCHECEGMDGLVFSVREGLIGGTVPPLHPLCRCSTAAYVE